MCVLHPCATKFASNCLRWSTNTSTYVPLCTHESRIGFGVSCRLGCPLYFSSSDVDGVCVRSTPPFRVWFPSTAARSVSVVNALQSRKGLMSGDITSSPRPIMEAPWPPERRAEFSPSTIRNAPLSASRSWRILCSSSSTSARCLRSVDTIRLACNKNQ